MIKIEHKNDRAIITSAVTDFASMDYCEQQVLLQYLGAPRINSKASRIGKIVHKALETREKKDATFIPPTEKIIVDKSQNIEFARETVKTRFEYFTNVDDAPVTLQLRGCTDKVYRSDETLIVQDEKTTKNVRQFDYMQGPYHSQKLQVLVYLNSKFNIFEPGYAHQEWNLIPHVKKQWIINIRNRNDGSIYKSFQNYQTKDDLIWLKSYLDRFCTILLHNESVEPSGSINKCKSCGFFNQCERRITA